MAIFTYDNEQDYWNALAVVKRLGVDYEDQHDELTIVTEELTDLETVGFYTRHAMHNLEALRGKEWRRWKQYEH